MALVSSLCDVCAHRQEGMTCTAFPSGIPEPLQLMKEDHRHPYKGDNGVLFKPSEEAAEFSTLPTVEPTPDMELSRRVAAVRAQLKGLPLQKQIKLTQAIRAGHTFDSLAPEVQALILNAERSASGASLPS